MASTRHISEQADFAVVAPDNLPESLAVSSNVEALDGDRLSTIIRFHNPERLPFLEEALFSLAIQSWPHHETVIVLQNGTDEMKKSIREIIGRQPWPDSSQHQIFSVDIPTGMDGRSTLLNRGIQRATGRYLAFLDDDDLIYQHGYVALVQQLRDGGGAVAVGGCRTSKVQYVSGHWYVQTKETPFAWGRNVSDLLRDNFIPIHSYVIDRCRVDAADLYFDDELPPLEDYDLLLRLCTKYEFDFSKLDIPVCEYRIHGLNSLPYDPNASPQSRDLHVRAQQIINERKKSLYYQVPVSEFVGLQQKLIESQQLLHQKTVELAEREREIKERFLLSFAYRIYRFFGRYPRLEKNLSHFTHVGWRAYKRIKTRGVEH